ncbi:hypothetical protein ANRL3_02919 [Anaerolineae bacterium]|nr:hypothetical protein ANRL3_02919 [Anaerolineae bacterium]
MNRIIPKILKWQRQARLRTDSDRWTNWVRSLIGRYMWIPLRHHSPLMMLVQPRIPLYMRCQRWENHAWGLYPKIDLAIGPILRETVLKGFSGTRMNWSDAKPMRKYSITNKEVPAEQLTEGKLKDRNWLEVNSLVQKRTDEFSPPGDTRQTSLNRVLRRMNQRMRLTLLTQSFVEQENHKILRRVVHEQRRVEGGTLKNTNGTFAISTKSSVPDMVVVRKRKDFSSVETDRTEMESQPHILRAGARIGQIESQTTSSPAINVEQITEQVIRQIDYRIRAYRERRGRPF